MSLENNEYYDDVASSDEGFDESSEGDDCGCDLPKDAGAANGVGEDSVESVSKNNKYGRAFLLQFQSMFNEKPDDLPEIEIIRGTIGLPSTTNKTSSKAGKGRAGGDSGRKGSSSGGGRGKNNVDKLGLTSSAPEFTGPVEALAITENRWKPSPKSAASETVIRTTLQATLNKLTPEKFDKLYETILELQPLLVSPEMIVLMVDLIIEKALLEPSFAVVYAQLVARLCKDLSNPDESSLDFRRNLLDRVREIFSNAPSSDNVDASTRAAVKARMLGNVKFIGEIYGMGVIPGKVIHQCAEKLLGDGGEEDVEALCKLLVTVGMRLDNGDHSQNITSYITAMRNLQHLSSRLRFMIDDIAELRSNQWIPKRIVAKTTGPSTLGQVREQIEKEAHMADAGMKRAQTMPVSPAANRGASKGGRGGNAGWSQTPQIRRGDSNGGWETTPSSHCKKGPGRGGLLKGQSSPMERSASGPSTFVRKSSTTSGAREGSRSLSPVNNSISGLKNNAFSALLDDVDNDDEQVLGAVVDVGRSSSTPLFSTQVQGKESSELDSVIQDLIAANVPAMLHEYHANPDAAEAKRCLQDLLQACRKMKGSPQCDRVSIDVICRWWLAIVEEGSSTIRATWTLLMVSMLKEKVLMFHSHSLRKIFLQLDDLAIDVPRAPMHLGQTIAPLLLDDVLSLPSLADAITTLKNDCCKGYLVGLSALAALTSEADVNVEARCRDCGVNPRVWIQGSDADVVRALDLCAATDCLKWILK